MASRLGTVLLVEDQNPYLFRELLNAYNGFEFVVAGRGDHAVEKFIELSPVLILMDVNLPVMNGIDAVRQIRKMNLAVPIIVMSAYTDKNTRSRALSAGATEFLSKPFNYKNLYRRMVELAATSRQTEPDAHIEALIKNKSIRLNLLKEKQALFGINAPVEILAEIASLDKEIDELLSQRSTSVVI